LVEPIPCYYGFKNRYSKSYPILQTPGMIKYGGKYYYDPALPEVQNHLIAVVDVVRDYDIDAIHFDDYFYPYKTRRKL
jgi:uncharacterized lipoprotein YddW (UPF0748 family)